MKKYIYVDMTKRTFTIVKVSRGGWATERTEEILTFGPSKWTMTAYGHLAQYIKNYGKNAERIIYTK